MKIFIRQTTLQSVEAFDSELRPNETHGRGQVEGRVIFIAKLGFNISPLAALVSFPRKRESRFRISPSGFPE
jgi:hypothetical protein